MPVLDLEPNSSLPRAELIRLLRPRIGKALCGARVVAEGVLAAESRIDFVAVEPSGRVVTAVVGEAGGELAAIGRALAQRSWLEARLADWLQIAPQLGAVPGAGILATVLCPTLSEEARTLAAAQGDALRLARIQFVRNGAGLEILIETPPLPVAPGGDSESLPVAALAAPAPAFRTGLTDADLGLTREDYGEFE